MAKRIMVVDDDPRIQMAVRNVLESRKYEVQSALSGRECLEKLETKGLPDLVLLDIMMEDMDGQTAFYKIVKKYPKLKVVFISALQPSEDSKLIMKAKGAEVMSITKPFTMELLLNTVKKALG
ncbi:MAG: response regulator [Candidatus Altiarchaeota archaeon]